MITRIYDNKAGGYMVERTEEGTIPWGIPLIVTLTNVSEQDAKQLLDKIKGRPVEKNCTIEDLISMAGLDPNKFTWEVV